MPTILLTRGFRFFFFSGEGSEPAHIHVEHGDKVAKYWLMPVELASSEGFRSHELTKLRALVIEHRALSWENGMSTLAIRLDSHAVDVIFANEALHLVLADGREISAPLAWFPRLRDANEAQRKNWRLIGKGVGVHWPEIDEDIAVSTLMKNN